MKTLIFLLIGAFCFAHGQNVPKEDSAIKVVAEKVNTVNKINQENEILIKELIAKKKQEKIIRQFNKQDQKSRKTLTNTISKIDTANSEAVKQEELKPIIEVDFKVYKDVIRGGFFYRLFHKDDFKIKYYKIVGDEKVYLN